MFKKTLMTAAAALAIIAGTTTINTSDANAGVSINLGFGGGYYGGYYGHRYYDHRYYGYRYYGHRDWH